MSESNPFRDLPGVDELASRFEGRLPWPLLVDVARTAVATAREDLGSGAQADPHAIAERLVSSMERASGVRVINATGVLLHTNLGRARLSAEAIERAALAGSSYTNLEIDLSTGERGKRGRYVQSLLAELTGAEDALVVNNNASAIVLSLAATNAGAAVPVSRGELIEIGGAYRLPEVMEASGAQLVEVGTTNRTRVGDYETALQTHTAGAILKVHTSNYRIEGFTSEADVTDLAELAGRFGVPLIHDIGSGLLDESAPWIEGGAPDWLSREPGARQSIAAGADLVTFSGDKLLGGPQAGIIVGKSDAVERLRSHPLSRALRVDGPTLGALSATLDAYARGEAGDLPLWQQALADAESIGRRASDVARAVGGKVVPGDSTLGAGSAPGASIPSFHVVLEDEDHLFGPLLSLQPPILARREGGSLVIDLRTVEPSDDGTIAAAISECR